MGTYRMTAGGGRGLKPVMTAQADWSVQLAPRLFAPPARCGWQAAAPVPVRTVTPLAPPPRPAWLEPPRPDTSALVAARSKAVTRVVWRLAFTVVAAVAFIAYQLVIEQQVDSLGRSAREVYGVVLIVVAALLALGVIRAVGGVRFASRNIRAFEQPYLVMRGAEQQRHKEALGAWEMTMRRHASDTAAAAAMARGAANGPQWFPVFPASEPTRIDVFGGDPRRHGWASLLVTFGSSLLSAGHRITVLDFTGQEVGENLVKVARVVGMPTRTVLLDGTITDAHLLSGLGPREIADCMGHALTSRQEGDRREERALATDVLRRVLACLDGPVTFARLAAGIRVLRQGTGDDHLSEEEISALAGHVGDVDQTEWTTRQLRFLSSQLDLLHELAPADHGRPLWMNEAVTLVATEGGLSDRKELIDRTLVRLVQQAMGSAHWTGGFLVVAGADHLGPGELRALSEHARNAKVRLVMMIESPQGDLEKSAGTGGAVCFMKQYNHRDANLAAEFIGKEHKFVLNSLTSQVGSTFTDGGGDSFAATTNAGNNSKQSRSGTPGRGTGLSDSRGHTWTGTRNWSNADNVSTSTAQGRVHEFKVEAEQLLGMPETAFVLVDNSGGGREVTLADCNPGLCNAPGVSAIPAGRG